MTEDREHAWEDYIRLCQAGGSLGYFELLELANLENPFKGNTVVDTINEIIKDLDKMEQDLK